MKSAQDGGPAFPRAGFHSNEGPSFNFNTPESGMSLRDWFAGQVIAAIYANPNWRGRDDKHEFARVAFEQADIALFERGTPGLAAANEQSESDLLLFARACTGGHVMVDTNDDELHVKSGPRTGPWEWPTAGLIEDGVPVFTDELRAALRHALEEGQVQP